MTAAIHFCCCPNSHPFKDRHILLKEPTKIGRSVARSRPATNNAVFDCKVLSRNHALLWYENGKFYIQDTRSSNGTFVNNQRLSKATEESAAVEVNSCDIVQFGVDVVDNTRKLTHGCIVSRIRLFLPNGEESKQSTTRNTSILEKVPFNNNPLPSVQSQDLYQLHQYLQEALHREQMLEQKLALLQRLVVNSHDASEKGWQALINEDRLLSRLEFLENQLQTLNKNQNEDELNMKLQQLQEDKYNYENTSKETLRKALQEKLEAVRKLSNLERSLSNTEDECTHLRLMHEQTQNELAELAATHQSKIKELHELTEKLQEMERKHEESKATIEIQQNELQRELTDLQQEESALRVKFNSLQEEADLRNTEKVPNNVCHEDRGIQVEQIDKIDKLFNGADELENIVNSGKLKHSLKDQMDDLTKLQEELISKNEVIEANEQEILSLKNDLDSARMAAVENVSEVTLLRHKLSEREDEMKTLLESATSDLQHQLSDAKLEIDARTNTADQLQDQLAEMESCLSELQNKHTMEVESRERCEAELKKFSEEKERQAISLTETNRELQAALYARAELLEQEESIRMQVEESEMMLKMCSSSGSELDSEDENSLSNGALVIYRGKLRNLRDKLKDSNKALEASQVENEELKEHLSKVQEKMATDEMVTVATQEFQPHVAQEVDLLVGGDCPVVDVKLLQDELDGAREELRMRDDKISELQDQVRSEREVASQLPRLQEQLGATQVQHQEALDELAHMRSQLSESEESIGELRRAMGILEEQVSVERSAADGHRHVINELQLQVQRNNDLIESLKRNEEEMTEKLTSSLQQIAEKQDRIVGLESDLNELIEVKESLNVDFEALTASLRVMSSKQLPQPSKIPPRTSPPTPRPHTFFSKIAPPSPRKFTRGTPRPQAEPLSVKPTAGGANAAFASNKHRDLLSDVIFENTLKKTSVTPQGVYHVGEGGNEVFIPKLRGLVDDEYVEVDRSKLADILAWAEREKAVISDELQKLEEARSHNEQLLQQEIARNQTLHEDSMKEQHKWEKVLSTKGDELTEVTSRCNELIRDREEAAQKLEHAASTKKHFIAALAILLALLLYFLLGSGTSPAAVPS